MKYYIQTIEQTNIEGVLNEYGKTEKVDDESTAFVKFYTRCSEVANAIGKTHTYMNIRIVNSYGVVVKEDTVGNYVTEEVTE